MFFIPKTLCKSLYVNINFPHIQNTCWIQSWESAIIIPRCSSLTFMFPLLLRLFAHYTYSCWRSIIRPNEETSSEVYTCMLINYSLIKKDFQTDVEMCDKDILSCFRLLCPLKMCHQKWPSALRKQWFGADLACIFIERSLLINTVIQFCVSFASRTE